MNFYNHHIRSKFKSHSISVTFKFCAVCVALWALEPRSTDSLGIQHRAKFESNTNRMTFEYAPNMMIVKVHPQRQSIQNCNFCSYFSPHYNKFFWLVHFHCFHMQSEKDFCNPQWSKIGKKYYNKICVFEKGIKNIDFRL